MRQLRARLAFQNAATRDLLTRLSPECGIVFDSEIDLSRDSLDLAGCSILFLEQSDDVEAVLPRIHSITGANPDLLLVVVVPAPCSSLDVSLLSAGAFDVVAMGPEIGRQLARTAAGARRILSLQEEKSRMGSDLAHQDKLAALGLLAAGVGHEVNNPCAAILANMSALREQLEVALARPRFQRLDAIETAAPDWLEAMADCIGAGKRIHSIVKTLNVFSHRSDALAAGPVDINDDISTVLRLIGKEVQFQATFEVSCDPDLPRIIAPPNTITQILTNLVVNALQALENTPPGRRKISIVTLFDDTHVMIEVSDNGPGIPADVIPKIFDPFFSTKPIGKGTGLGLAITRQLVEKANGEIFVESAPGDGALFRLVFERQPADTITRPRVSTVPPVSDRLRVMIVDDDELTLRSMQRSLASQFECIALTTGNDALSSLQRDAEIDVVLSDIVMPGMNGFEFYLKVIMTHPQLADRIAFMTGGVTSEQLRVSVSETGQPLLNKPIDVDELIRTIRTLGTGMPLELPR